MVNAVWVALLGLIVAALMWRRGLRRYILPFVDVYKRQASIQTLQQKLFDLGLFTADNAPQPGVFDQRTLEIVLSFQQSYNAQNPGAPLLEVDPTDPNAVIDATTVSLIMNAEIPMG